MKKWIFSVLTLMLAFTMNAQMNSVQKLNKSKAPNFAITATAPAVGESNQITGPAEKNVRNKPWLKENKPSGVFQKKRIYGPKGKFLMNRGKQK